MRVRIRVGLSISALSMAASSGGRPGPRSEGRRTVPLPPSYQVTIQLLGLAPALQEEAQLPSNCARPTTDRTDSAAAAAPLSRPSATMMAIYPGDFMHVPFSLPCASLEKPLPQVLGKGRAAAKSVSCGGK